MTLEERVSERTRIARDLHDTLLQSLDVEAICEDMKNQTDGQIREEIGVTA